MDILRWLVEHFQKQGRAIRQAPAALTVALIILGALVFAGVEWHFAGVDSAQQATIEMLREELKGASPQLAAIQSRRTNYRGQLLALYAKSGPLMRRELPPNSPTDRNLNPEVAARFLSDAKSWEQETATWLAENLGETARERFLDVDRGNYYNFASDNDVNVAFNRLAHLRQNLETLIETAAYDK
jgi:hypothetical protein